MCSAHYTRAGNVIIVDVVCFFVFPVGTMEYNLSIDIPVKNVFLNLKIGPILMELQINEITTARASN